MNESNESSDQIYRNERMNQHGWPWLDHPDFIRHSLWFSHPDLQSDNRCRRKLIVAPYLKYKKTESFVLLIRMKLTRHTVLGLIAAVTAPGSAAFIGRASSAVAHRAKHVVSSNSNVDDIPVAEKVLRNPKWPPEWPYSDIDFARMDETEDTVFYSQPRLVYHIDDPAVSSLTKYYAENFKDGEDVLDICSSWVSHYPKDWKSGNVVGLGMNDYELSQNKQLSSYVVKDLNEEPLLPFDDASFDKVTCVVSIDYLNKPLQVVKEIGRVLRPGGECILSMSNRW
jgi:Methyltransferase domain